MSILGCDFAVHQAGKSSDRFLFSPRPYPYERGRGIQGGVGILECQQRVKFVHQLCGTGRAPGVSVTMGLHLRGENSDPFTVELDQIQIQI